MLNLNEQLEILRRAEQLADAAVKSYIEGKRARRMGESTKKAVTYRRQARERLIETLKEIG